MNHRIVTLIAAGIIGSAALGLETVAVSRAAQGVGDALRTAEAAAMGRAGRILAESLGQAAAEQARGLAMDATLGVVRGVSAVYATMQPRAAAAPAPVRVVHVRKVWTWSATADSNTDQDVETCCDAKRLRSES